ncbi:MAG: 16S rRNA (guanine(966)-N(2))-methyltransferase RsmD, partial [Candidatus Rokuibacteriota bacterium]
MRIVGGGDRGRRLYAPRGRGTRPTAERVRVLDLFAGTGAVGIEALSRGAARSVFVEKEREAVRALRRNLAALGASRKAARVVVGDVVTVLPLLAREEAPVDLAFLDPPYAAPRISRALDALVQSGLLGPGARVVVQHFAKGFVDAVPGLVSDREP